jgi:hypothetical protein
MPKERIRKDSRRVGAEEIIRAEVRDTLFLEGERALYC